MRRKWQPTTIFMPLIDYRLWSLKESDTTEQLTHTQTQNNYNYGKDTLKNKKKT